jgi:Protein of unknown function (DUF3565)
MSQAIVGFHHDEVGDWVAELACGHTQHVRHQPSWSTRPWVIPCAVIAMYTATTLPLLGIDPIRQPP